MIMGQDDGAKAKEELEDLLNRIRILNIYIKVFRQGLEANNMFSIEKEIEKLAKEVGLDFADYGYLNVSELVPENFKQPRMVDLLKHAEAHMEKLLPQVEKMVKDPKSITVNKLEDMIVETTRALDDIVRDQKKLKKEGHAGDYILTSIIRGMEDLGGALLKIGNFFKKGVNEKYQDVFQKSEGKAEKVVEKIAKGANFLPFNLGKKFKKVAAQELDIGSLQEKFKAESKTMGGELPKVQKHTPKKPKNN